MLYNVSMFFICLIRDLLFRLEDFLVLEFQVIEEEKSKLEFGLINGEEFMDQDLFDVFIKCVFVIEFIEIK